MEPDRTPDLEAVPPAPREPSYLARQLVVCHGPGALIVALVGGFFLAFGSVFSVAFGWNLPKDVAIELNRVNTTGAVDRVETEDHVSVNEQHPTRLYFRYEFEGQTYQGSSATLEFRQASGEFATATVPVEVCRWNPGWARMQGTTCASFGYGGAGALLFPLIGGTMLYFALRGKRRRKRAFIWGTPAVARIVYRGPDTSVTVNNRHPWVVRWEFSAEGQTHKGSLSNMSEAPLYEATRGDEVVVLYDPENPKINTLYVP